MKHFSWDGADLLLRLRVSPRASRDKVGDVMGDRLKISITALPVDGKANTHLQSFIARQCHVAKSQVTVVSGASHRDKTVRVNEPDTLPTVFLVVPE